MADFKTTKDFRKMRLFNDMHEDPTFISFFLMFDYITEHSPLFNGQARNYLLNTVRDEKRVEHLDNFIKILKLVNSEMPWFWQSITGLEKSVRYGDMKDPYRGATEGGESAIDIACLETVELTTAGMMDLYRKAAYDYDRYVEVLPENLRRFSMYVYVTEVRSFKRKPSQVFSHGRDRGDYESQALSQKEKEDVRVAKPFFKINLGHCTFDIDSATNIFEGLKKTPEGAAVGSMRIKYGTTHDADRMYANSVIYDQDRTAAGELAQAGLDKLEQIGGGLAQRGIDNLKGALFLGNVYGGSTISDLQDAVRAGSINGLGNLLR